MTNQATTFMDSDLIVLHTIESYLKSMGADTVRMAPETRLALTQSARDYLYSEIAQRVPNIAANILHADLDVEDKARALFMALSDHCKDPIFIKILMQYIGSFPVNETTRKTNLIVGALLAKILSKYIEDHTTPVTNSTKKEKDKKEEKAEVAKPEGIDADVVAHLQDAVNALLGGVADVVATRCGTLTNVEALAIAACLATNDDNSVKEIINSDLPITADIFAIIADPTNIIKGSLLLEKKDFLKLTPNQTKFVESLQRWVFDMLDKRATQQQLYSFLLSIYGNQPDTNKYLINIKDCGTQYSNLLTVTKFMTR